MGDRAIRDMMHDLTAKEYIRERIAPKPGDSGYLSLVDLLLAIRQLIPPGSERVLDYGSGGSPYRSLFGDCVYHRADFAGGQDLDYEYGPDARLPPSTKDYDCVLSTQVLEHVPDPGAYLRNCCRILRPGGYLLLTTHGLFEDHACPHDYWRWTVYGLRQIVEDAGLTVRQLRKVTTGPRASVFLAGRELHRLRFRGPGMYTRLLSAGVGALRRFGSRRLHEATDAAFPNCRVVDATEFGHDTYIVIALLASR